MQPPRSRETQHGGPLLQRSYQHIRAPVPSSTAIPSSVRLQHSRHWPPASVSKGFPELRGKEELSQQLPVILKQRLSFFSTKKAIFPGTSSLTFLGDLSPSRGCSATVQYKCSPGEAPAGFVPPMDMMPVTDSQFVT